MKREEIIARKKVKVAYTRLLSVSHKPGCHYFPPGL